MLRWNPYNELRRMREEMDRRGAGNYPTTEGGEMEWWTVPKRKL
jgi:hypothetical protein